ncbi:MAG: UbiD family decarboxylase [Sphingobacteriales bacterium]|nr:UbiD family decarboxylase [Sphingobacteriales bacterium]
MPYTCTLDCLLDLEKSGQLIRIKNEVNPDLEMAAIHRRVFSVGGPALWFERVKGSPFGAASNLFGTKARSRWLFRHTLKTLESFINLKIDPTDALKRPLKYAHLPFKGLTALPRKPLFAKPVLFGQTTISALPQIKSWPNDGGAFVTLPQVYSEDFDKPGVMKSNLGMYRIQLSGNEYIPDKEIGLHYQIHRGIGVHQTKANQRNQPLKVSIFVGGPPAHSLAAVMPLPEGLPELAFAGVLAGRAFRYVYKDGYCLSTDADFVITGYVNPHENKPEGPFGDHLGYYSLKHPFPLMHVEKVWHRKNAIWPFTIVGRPPQEDTYFGSLIHDITGAAIPNEIPGLEAVHAIDDSGVHPLLLAIGNERYTPYYTLQQPQELLTITNHILGTGQLSLAKFLLIIAKNDAPNLKINDVDAFLTHLLERIDTKRDLHFYTNTTIDTLDYSGTGLNSGSKLVLAAVGQPIRQLSTFFPDNFKLPDGFRMPKIAHPGIMVIQAPVYNVVASGNEDMAKFCQYYEQNGYHNLLGFPLIVLCDDAEFTARNLHNFLWVVFTRCNPSHDVHGIAAFTRQKHWGCQGPLVFDARIKPDHAPPLEPDPEIEKRVDALGAKGGPLHGII